MRLSTILSLLLLLLFADSSAYADIQVKAPEASVWQLMPAQTVIHLAGYNLHVIESDAGHPPAALRRVQPVHSSASPRDGHLDGLLTAHSLQTFACPVVLIGARRISTQAGFIPDIQLLLYPKHSFW